MLSRITAVLASALVCWVSVVTTAHATFPGNNGRIAFWRVEPNEDYDIYTVNADGSDLARLTNHDAFPGDSGGSFQPKWSPDGRTLVFREGALFAMSADGSGRVQLTNGLG